MKAVIVTPQIPIAYATGGIGTFVWNLCQLLHSQGEQVEVVFTHPAQKPAHEWMPNFERLGIHVTELHARPTRVPLGYTWHDMVAERAAAAIPADADVVYFADWEANGCHFVRSQRYSPHKLPVSVLVLHGSSKWNRQGMYQYATHVEELAHDFKESYVAQHADYVVSPSQYMVDWARMNAWKLPPDERVRVLGYPFFPVPHLDVASGTRANCFTRIVFYGRLDSRKGIDLFVNALTDLADQPYMQSIEEIVLLGGPAHNGIGTPEKIAELLMKTYGQRQPHPQVRLLTDFTTFEAQAYLAQIVAGSLVVMPSRVDNLPFGAIEASLIPGLNLLCSRSGGTPEVLGPRSHDQLFDPNVPSLRAKLREWLLAGPRGDTELGRYDWEAHNQQWVAFHEEVRAQARTRAKTVSKPASNLSVPHEGRTAVDVCVPYHNLGAYLPDLLESLAQQTTQDFSVYAVDDGSTQADDVKAFERLALQYARMPRWHFERIEHRGVCEARNFAVSLGNSDLLCFVDADNVLLPHAIERFVDGMRESGDDCLTCYLYLFEGDAKPPVLSEAAQPNSMHFLPVGASLTLGMFSNVFGDTSCVIRRSVFEALDGFTSDYTGHAGHEDRELFARLLFAGHSLDVIPKPLVCYRVRPDSRERTAENYLSNDRVLRHYRAALEPHGLSELADIAVGGQQGQIASNRQYLVNHVSGFHLLDALRLKVRNQIARRLGRPIVW